MILNRRIQANALIDRDAISISPNKRPSRSREVKDHSLSELLGTLKLGVPPRQKISTDGLPVTRAQSRLVP